MNIFASNTFLWIGGGVTAIAVVALCIMFLTRKKKDEPQMIHDDIEKIVDEQAKMKAEQNANSAGKTTLNHKEVSDDKSAISQKEVSDDKPALSQKKDSDNKPAINQKEGSDDKPAISQKKSEATQKKAPTQASEVENANKPEGAVRESAVRYRVIFDKITHTWIIKKDNANRVIRRVRTKEEALRVAKELSKNHDTALVVHKKDGKFQKK